MNQLHNQCQKDKQFNITLSYESFRSFSQNNQINIQNISNKSTSSQKISSYLNFFAKTSAQDKYLINPLNHPNYQKTQFFQLQNKKDQILNDEDLKSQSPQKTKTQLNQNTLRFLSSYQSYHRERLQKKILESGRFRKVDSFTSELLVYDMHPSKHYEVIKLGVQLLWYRTQILILNIPMQSPLPEIGCFSGSGSFGTIYFIRTINDQIAIKNISISQTNHSNQNFFDQICSLLMRSIRQYFWLLLFSQLEIGPQVKNICGFDMILYEDCIQFATEICQLSRNSGYDEDKKYKSSVSMALFDMHMLQVVHKDIKPFNIMFSPMFKKHVLIDFGCSEAVKQSLGEMTFTNFAGTASYCSNQMFALLQKKRGLVDMYFNDLFGLKKTFNDETKDIFKQRGIILRSKNFHYEQLSMKYLLYHNDFATFFDLWQKVTKTYCDERQEIQMSILQFIPELKITAQIKHFYWTQINQTIRELPEFKQLNLLMLSQQQLFAQIRISNNKQKLYFSFEKIYNTIKINASTLSNKERQLDYILINKQKLLQFLQSFQEILKGTQKNNFLEDENQLTNTFLIIALYCSLASNQYTSQVEKKINVCKIGLQLFRLKYGKEKDKNIIFYSSLESFIPVVKFYQLFLHQIWPKVLNRYKSISIINSLITLYLLGYPTNFNNVVYVLIQWPILTTEQSIQCLTQQERFLAIRIFWECKLVTLFYSQIFYNFSKHRIVSQNLTCKQQKEFQLIDKILFHYKTQGQLQILFKVNHQLYHQLILNFLNFDNLSYEKMISLLNIPKLIQLEKYNYDIRKWRSLMKLVLCSFGQICNIQTARQTINKIHSQVIFQHQYKHNILPYTIFFFFQNSSQDKTINQVFHLIDQIINSKSISLRIFPQKRLKIILLTKDFQTIDLMTQLIKKQSNWKEFLICQHPIIFWMLIPIQMVVQQYIQDLPILNSQAVYFLGKCFQLIKQFIHIGYLHYDSNRDILTTKIFLSNQINSELIQSLFNKGEFIKKYFILLLKVSSIFFKLSNLIKKQNQVSMLNVNTKFSLWDQIKPEQITFLNTISSNKTIFSYANLWLQSFKKYPKVKQIIKSNRALMIKFFQIYSSQRQTLNQIYKGQEIIQDLFDFKSPEIFLEKHHYKIIPSFQIAFDYFQIKLIKTNYKIQQCLMFIKLFKICVEKKCFQLIFQKKGILRFIFNSYLYTKRSFQQILLMLIIFTKTLENQPKKNRIKILVQNLNSFFWCKCQNCFPRPTQNWNNLEFVEYLYQTISQVKCSQNPYMGLVYYFAMMGNEIRIQVIQRFIKFIIKSMFYASKRVGNVIIVKIHFYVYSGFLYRQREEYFDKKGLKIDMIN